MIDGKFWLKPTEKYLKKKRTKARFYYNKLLFFVVNSKNVPA